MSLTLGLSVTFIDFLPRYGSLSRVPRANFSAGGELTSLVWVPEDCPEEITDPEKVCSLPKNHLSCTDNSSMHFDIGKSPHPSTFEKKNGTLCMLEFAPAHVLCVAH